LDGNTLTFPGGAGKVIIEAHQPGNELYHSAETASINFCVLAVPEISINNSGSNAVVLISNYPEGNQWFLDGLVIEGGTGEQHVVTQVGEYALQVTVDGCASSISGSVDVVLTGLGGVHSQGIQYYPNPVKEDLTIRFANDFEGNSIRFTLISMDGKVIFEEKHRSVYSEFILDLANIQPGPYVLRIDLDREKVIQINLVKD
jgi:hypothetical protein